MDELNIGDRVLVNRKFETEEFPWAKAYTKVGCFRIVEIHTNEIAVLTMTDLQKRILEERIRRRNE